MSILDEIANPQIPSYLENIKVMENLKDRRAVRQAQEIQTGIALQKMQLEKQQLEQQKQGLQTIQQRLQQINQPTETQATTTQQPTVSPSEKPAEIPQYIKAPQEPAMQSVETAVTQPQLTPAQEQAHVQQAKQTFNTFSQIPTDYYKRSKDLNDLADSILSIPGMQPYATAIYNQANQALTHAERQTKDQFETMQKLRQQFGNAFYSVSQLEDDNKPDQAAVLYKQTRDFIMNDPTFNRMPEITQIFNNPAFSDYHPGVGHYLSYATSVGDLAHDAVAGKRGVTTFQKETAEGYTGIFDKQTGALVDYARDAQGNPIKTGVQARFQERAAAQEKRAGETQARFDTRMKAQEKRDEQTQKKFEVKNTFDMMRYKRQEDKDLKEQQAAINRALALVQKGENLPLVDKLLQQAMSKWENTSVRAYAELEKFKNYGPLTTRIAGSLSQFTSGTMTNEQRQMAVDVAQTMLNDFIDPALNESNSYWRRIAAENNLDPDQVAAYSTKEEVGQDYAKGNISRDQALKILSKPRFK